MGVIFIDATKVRIESVLLAWVPFERLVYRLPVKDSPIVYRIVNGERFIQPGQILANPNGLAENHHRLI
jgi:hypothetical protein